MKGATKNQPKSQMLDFILAASVFSAIGAMLAFGMLAGV